MNQNFDTAERKTILVVDDRTVYLEMMSVMIGDVYDLRFATNGQKALDILKTEKDISLVLLDFVMPYMGGAEFLIEAKKDPELRDIPVIVLTTSEDNEVACLSLGAVDFIKKPYPLRSDVLEKIEKALNSSKKATSLDLDSYINALFSEYNIVYLIDALNDTYDSIVDEADYRALNLKNKGEDFFTACVEDAKKVVYEEDYDMLVNALQKDNLIEALRSDHSLSLDYRLVIDGKPKHYRFKAMLVPDECPQIIIGVTCTEDEFAGMETLYAFRNDPHNYADITQSLASDFMCLYLVHLESNRFVEYMADAEFARFRLDKSGDNFFTFCLKSLLDGANPADIERVTHLFNKENVLKTIEKHRAFTMPFRLTFEGNDEYVSLKVTKLVQNGVEYLVVGISNIDAQVHALQG